MMERKKETIIVRMFFHFTGFLYELCDKMARNISTNIPESVRGKVGEFCGKSKNAELKKPFYIIESNGAIFSKENLGSIWEHENKVTQKAAAELIIKRAEERAREVSRLLGYKAIIGEVDIKFKIQKIPNGLLPIIGKRARVLLLDPDNPRYETQLLIDLCRPLNGQI